MKTYTTHCKTCGNSFASRGGHAGNFVCRRCAKGRPEPMDEAVRTIARERLRIEHLDMRWSDALDFHEVAVWSLREALEEAYRAGQASR